MGNGLALSLLPRRWRGTHLFQTMNGYPRSYRCHNNFSIMRPALSPFSNCVPEIIVYRIVLTIRVLSSASHDHRRQCCVCSQVHHTSSRQRGHAHILKSYSDFANMHVKPHGSWLVERFRVKAHEIPQIAHLNFH